MQVRAIREGYDNVAVRQPGEVFEMPDDTVMEKNCWFQRLEGRKRKPTEADASPGDADLV